MFNVVLYEPEIPPNTGNIIRLCANTGARLHLAEPLGFRLEDRLLRRAGLDYHEYAEVRCHASLADCWTALGAVPRYAFSSRGAAVAGPLDLEPDAALLFGPETRGLPGHVLETFAPERVLRLPMRPGVRSLNLSNAVAVAVYLAWARHDFAGAAGVTARSSPMPPGGG